MKLSPSVLSADFVHLKEQLDICKEEGVTDIHFDMMDGDFVPAISFGDPILKCISKEYDLFMDAHLMVTEPSRFFDACAKAGANGLTVHVEACKHIDRTIQAIKDLGLKAGVALNPGTPICMIEDIMDSVDMILIMSVNPGFGGQKFIPYTLNKIRRLNAIRRDNRLNYELQIDGGVNKDNIHELVAAGCDNIVAGSAVFKGDIRTNIQALYNNVK